MVKTILGIDGMMCPMCEAHMNDAIRKEFNVKKVESSHKDKKTEIISETELDSEKIKEVVAGTGYTLLGIESEPYEKKGFSIFGKK
ncbi:MAG: ATPase P [Oscillospiraceae bacterium]|nr:ATPase P [Oscillospiraceae bacterium]